MADEQANQKFTIDDELIRERVRRALADERSRKRESISKNPLTAVIVGFLLTGLCGAWITNRYQNRQAEEERRLRRYESSVKAVQDLSRNLYERHTRSALLYSALIRHATREELIRRKLEYDGSYLAYNRDLQANLLTIRDLLQSPTYTPIEHQMQVGLSPRLKYVDACLTQAFDDALKDKWTVLVTCSDAQSVLPAIVDCDYSITNLLYARVSTTMYATDESSVKEAAEELVSRCPSNPDSEGK